MGSCVRSKVEDNVYKTTLHHLTNLIATCSLLYKFFPGEKGGESAEFIFVVMMKEVVY